MLPEFPRGTVAFLWSPVAHCGAKPSCPRRIARNSARRSLPKPNSWPANQRHSFACLLLASVSCALQPDCADSIPIAQRSARWFSPTGFLANRSRWRHRRPYRTQCAASARLKTLCIMYLLVRSTSLAAAVSVSSDTKATHRISRVCPRRYMGIGEKPQTYVERSVCDMP